MAGDSGKTFTAPSTRMISSVSASHEPSVYAQQSGFSFYSTSMSI
jgi:hypothetical protein